MANPNFNDVLTTTLENRMGELADNVTKNNALLYRAPVSINAIEDKDVEEDLFDAEEDEIDD